MLKNCLLYGSKNKRWICRLLAIGTEWIKKEKHFASCYSFGWLQKHKYFEKDFDQEALFIDPKKPVPEVLDDATYCGLPESKKEEYRPVIFREAPWLKAAQKKLNKLFLRGFDRSLVPFLKSTIKNTSSVDNAIEHCSYKHTLFIDLKDFFTQIKYAKVAETLRKYLLVEKDVAGFLAKIMVAPMNKTMDNLEDFVLGQGLATSGFLAFLCNYDLFNELNDYANSVGLHMTVYVDDITFSSKDRIPHDVIQHIFDAIKAKGLMISRKKIMVRNGTKTVRKVTGVIIKNNDAYIPRKKMHEILRQYEYLKKSLFPKIDIDGYLSLLEVFVRFKGNVEYYKNVEGKSKHSKKALNFGFVKFANQYGPFFPAIRLKDKSKACSKTNMSALDYKKCQRLHNGLALKLQAAPI